MVRHFTKCMHPVIKTPPCLQQACALARNLHCPLQHSSPHPHHQSQLVCSPCPLHNQIWWQLGVTNENWMPQPGTSFCGQRPRLSLLQQYFRRTSPWFSFPLPSCLKPKAVWRVIDVRAKKSEINVNVWRQITVYAPRVALAIIFFPYVIILK